MATLGVFLGPDEHAVAVAEEGRLLGAAEGGPPSAVVVGRSTELSLGSAGLGPASVERVVLVRGRAGADAPLPSWVRSLHTSELPADGALTSSLRPFAADGFASVALPFADCDTSGRVEASSRRLSSPPATSDRDSALGWAIREVASALGCENTSLDAIEAVAGDSGLSDDHSSADLFRVDSHEPAVRCERAQLAERIAMAQRSSPVSLAEPSRHVSHLAARRALATDVLNALASAIAGATRQLRERCGAHGLLIAGAGRETVEFERRVRRFIDGPVTSPVRGGHVAAALGAALQPCRVAEPATDLALGPGFDERDIKTALESCRLEFVYEPDWSRLYSRVSSLLSGGALVGWFQGRSDLGSNWPTSRSVLADAGIPYARHNVEEFLLKRPYQSRPLGLAALEATDVRDERSVYHITPSVQSTLAHLLAVHMRAASTAGLYAVPLVGASTPQAQTPLEAIQSVFGSPVDVLVAGRFIVSKDHWLLRQF